jgi:hypothetical protein
MNAMFQRPLSTREHVLLIVMVLLIIIVLALLAFLLTVMLRKKLDGNVTTVIQGRLSAILLMCHAVT